MSFFRDPPAWQYLADEVIPSIVAQKERAHLIRVWSAGCATGAEAYTVAMLLAEAVGEPRFRERVKIYATDVDEDALLMARHAVYGAKDVEDVPAELRERC